ncbi:DUF2938 domain-containing protein [Sphingopyxis sp. MWB1]|uniref:DUF2938 domain-containing protein n=1 Tax=Sphingopyxis sp. MWB1 TaxID=1537715 RepID=UPI00051A27F5|nr:DUF2938 domain-containing protein [Sphingopyxis sp. MWB1]
MEFLGYAAGIGVGATLLLDLWAIAAERLLGLTRPNWAMVGRWIAHMAEGRWRHENIAAAAPRRGERALGWAAHYAIGIGFAALLLILAGRDWAMQPTLLPALAVGVATVLAPFFILQPAMGAGVAAAKTPNPARARMTSLISHMIFGLGLYGAALALAWLRA